MSTQNPKLCIGKPLAFVIVAAALALATAPASAALIAHYSFETDALTDETGNNNDGSSTNGQVDLVTSAAPVPGGSSQAVRFNLDNSGDIVDDDSYIDLPEGDAAEPDTDLFINGSYTIATWVNVQKRSGAGNNGAAKLVGSSSNSSPWAHNYLLRLFYSGHDNSDKVGFIARDSDGSTTIAINDPDVPELDTWYHYAVTFELDGTSATATMYRDGDFVVDATATDFGGFSASDLNAELADSSPGTDDDGGFNGLLDDVRIYDEALTQPEIQGLVIPEPATLALLGLGGAVMLGRRRR